MKDVIFGLVIYINNTQRNCMYELERDELTLDEFRQKIKDDYSLETTWGELGPLYGKQWRNVSKRELVQVLHIELTN